jgi:hypothetical protein
MKTNQLDNVRLGRIALLCAGLSLLALLSTLLVPAAALVTAFLALSVAAALLGFASRRTQVARLGLLLVPITLVLALAVTAYREQR